MVGSKRAAFPYERGTPVCGLLTHHRVSRLESRASWARSSSSLLSSLELRDTKVYEPEIWDFLSWALAESEAPDKGYLIATGVQGYLAHKKHPPPWDQYESLGIGLL
jgi:hypothetical protein